MRKRAIPVREFETGEEFPSVTAAARAIGVTVPSLREAIMAHRACKGRYFVYDMPDAYCACCKTRIDLQVA